MYIQCHKLHTIKKKYKFNKIEETGYLLRLNLKINFLHSFSIQKKITNYLLSDVESEKQFVPLIF